MRIDLTDVEELERASLGHAHPTPLLVRALCLVVREVRALRVEMAARPAPRESSRGR